LNGFGFLAGRQVKEAGIGNLGLQDRALVSFVVDVFLISTICFFYNLERLALRWIQKYISAFGGDPTKVTLYGPFHPSSSARVCVTDFLFHNKKDGENQLELSPSLYTWSPALPRNPQQHKHKHKIYIVQPSCNPDHLYLLGTSQMDNASTTTWLLKPAVRARWWTTLWLVYDTFRMRGLKP